MFIRIIPFLDGGSPTHSEQKGEGCDFDVKLELGHVSKYLDGRLGFVTYSLWLGSSPYLFETHVPQFLNGHKRLEIDNVKCFVKFFLIIIFEGKI